MISKKTLAVASSVLFFLGMGAAASAQVQSHPLSQISPIDSNLNAYLYNVSVAYLNYSYGIMNNGTQGLLTADIASSAVTGSRIASSAITSSKISNPLGGLLNATAFYDSDNSNYFLDAGSLGTSLAIAGSLGIGATSPIAALDLGLNHQIFLGGNSNSWGWYVNVTDFGSGNVPLIFTERNGGTNTERMRIAQGGSVGIGTTSPGATLDVVGTTTTRRSTAAAVGGTLNIGGGTYAWQITGNQLNGGDLMIRNPNSENVIYLPQTGDSVGINTTNPGATIQANGPTASSFPTIEAYSSGQSIILNPYECQGCTNPLVQVGDQAIIFSNGSINTGNLVIGSWNGGSAGGVRITSNGNMGLNTSTPQATLDVSGGIRFSTTSLKPSCSSTIRGEMWFEQGSPEDKMYICMQNSTSVYNWVLVARGG